MDESTWIAQAEAWLACDPDPATAAELRRLLERPDIAMLAELFAQRLEFGTAGIRGLLGPGPGRMNRLLVRRVARGLADHLHASVSDADLASVVVGGDARRGSDVFVADCCAVLAATGLRVHRFRDPVPTPVVAYAARKWNCAAAIVVTASHNPPAYNGIKVYSKGGRQIVPPEDAAISSAIDAANPAPEVEPSSDKIRFVPEQLLEDYLADIARARRQPKLKLDLDVVYTPLHGVGGATLCRALTEHGVRVRVVGEQFQPDASFPTVRFPNPEEPGALDLALALAAKEDAELLLANDPDADRLAVGVRSASGHRILSGNELGALLGEYLLRFDQGTGRPLVMTTIVSSRLLSRIAAHHGAHYAETLTGFKWIADLAARHEQAHASRFIFGYEEALGYTIDHTVADKDGIGTALLVCELAAWCKQNQRNLLDFLAEIELREGAHRSHLHSMQLTGAEGQRRIQAILSGLRERPAGQIGTAAVRAQHDYSVGLNGLPPADVLALELADGGRILVRPSGTEPKIKFYFELRAAPGQAEALPERLDRLVQAFLEQLP